MANLSLKVEGMSCGHCVSAVEKALREIGAQGKVDLEAKKVDIEYDDSKLQPQAIKEAIEGQGYDVV
ncbi:copper chaperone [Xylanibacillus composti]|uniref:Copper chaperone CopZ n=1 Tax=Xylanibacillus composti TaxID=1572762 RepID=A0A8J4H148_9BACL|nr:copper ion binding protein [Xylanibacillus composti]MDT9725551.1 copper chaperone [Xylanibacillus composti]GIQ67645.1 copper chaperone CopZ [Xylanibacillus composti]